MINPGELQNFRVDFNNKIIFNTIYDLFEQFRGLNIQRFEIELFGYTCQKEKKSVYIKNEIGEWTLEGLNLDRINNLFAILQEHNNKEVFFNVIYFKD